MSERLPCATPDCPNTVLPETAQRTKGLCMPCVQKARDKSRAQEPRRDVNEFEGVTDPVEALKIIHRPRRFDRTVNWIPHPTPMDRLYAELSGEEASRMAEHAESLIRAEPSDEAERILECLSAFTDVSLDRCLRTSVEHGLFRPALAFRKSPEDVRDLLMERVNWDGRNRNHILLALAWIGDEVVARQFAEWRKNPPAWRSSLYVPPEAYAKEAGWELDENGQRRNLYSIRCHALEEGSSPPGEMFHAITKTEGSCPWCQQPLIHLFELTPEAFGMEDDLPGTGQIPVLTCEACTAFGAVFGEYDEDGQSRWSTANVRPSYLPDNAASWDRLPANSLRAADLRPPFFAASQFLPTRFSQLGGHPTWVQDAAYPACPRCSRTMRFLAQLERGEIEKHGEGTYYAFVCASCRTTATEYQQT